MRATLRVLACLLPLFVSATAASGQTFTRGIRGVVSDANGVVRGATITLTSEETNLSRVTVTNDVGQYSFPAVPPGTTRIHAHLAAQFPLHVLRILAFDRLTGCVLVLPVFLGAIGDRLLDSGVELD